MNEWTVCDGELVGKTKKNRFTVVNVVFTGVDSLFPLDSLVVVVMTAQKAAGQGCWMAGTVLPEFLK